MHKIYFHLLFTYCFQPAYNYSVENQMLTAALEKQESHVRHVYSTIAGKIPLTPAYIKPSKGGNAATFSLMVMRLTMSNTPPAQL